MPATMTTVWPMAIRPTMTIDWLRLFMRFCQERNSGWSQTTTVTMAMSARISERLSTPMVLMTRRAALGPSSAAGCASPPLRRGRARVRLTHSFSPPAIASAAARLALRCSSHGELQHLSLGRSRA